MHHPFGRRTAKAFKIVSAISEVVPAYIQRAGTLVGMEEKGQSISQKASERLTSIVETARFATLTDDERIAQRMPSQKEKAWRLANDGWDDSQNARHYEVVRESIMKHPVAPQASHIPDAARNIGIALHVCEVAAEGALMGATRARINDEGILYSSPRDRGAPEKYVTDMSFAIMYATGLEPEEADDVWLWIRELALKKETPHLFGGIVLDTQRGELFVKTDRAFYSSTAALEPDAVYEGWREDKAVAVCKRAMQPKPALMKNRF